MNKRAIAIGCWILGALGIMGGFASAQTQYSSAVNQTASMFGYGRSLFSFLVGSPLLLIGMVAAVVGVVLYASSPSTSSAPLSGLGAVPVASSPSVPAAWHPDPLRRHEFRYWNSTQWTSNVSDGGVQSEDPL